MALLLVVFWGLVPVQAEEVSAEAAPFGLTWGMGAAQVRAQGVTLVQQTGKDYGTTFLATKLSKVLPDVQAVLLSFGYDDRLWRIAAVSRDFPNDPYGAAVRQRYDELAGILVQKYGAGQVNHHVDPNPYLKADAFLMEINMGKAWHYTDFNTDKLFIQLGIGASDGSTGYWRLIYVNKPLRADFAKGRAKYEKGAL